MALVIFASCVNTKKITYFNDTVTPGADSVNRLQQLKIQPGDILQITVTTFDKEISQIFNPNTAAAAGQTPGNGMDQGYLVDSSGYIAMPVIGKLYVKDKTTAGINELVTAELSKTVRNVYVSTRLVNFRVSVLGDVARPGSFRIGGERASVLDALSMAGDLNVTAKRNDVMVIREINGVKSYGNINLNDINALSSPYYYLTNNDIIYVKPGPNKSFPSSRTIQLLPVITGIISLITTIVILSK